jgi:hypothetical protein
MSWQPLIDNEIGYTNATHAPKIHLPPFEEAFENPGDKFYDVQAGYDDRSGERPEAKKSMLTKLFNRDGAKKRKHGGGGSDHGPFGKVNRGGEEIWLESFSFPGAKSGHHKRKRRLDRANRRKGFDHSSSSGGRSGLKDKIKSLARGKGLFKEDRKGESIWLESSSNHLGSSSGGPYHKKKGYGGSSSSSSGGYWGKPDGKGGCYCSIGRSEKGDDAALITLGSIGIPLAIVGSVLGGALGSGAFAAIINSTLNGIGNLIPGGRVFDGRAFDAGFDVDFFENPIGNVLKLVNSPFSKFMRNPIANLKANLQGFSRTIEDGFSVLLWKFATRGFGSSGGCFDQARG